jgi:cyclopropane fatty-acyl-phospholipid synthase-like methyltransferase
MWDEVYSIDEYVYGESANDFLLEMTANLKEGNALCLAEGEGRNATHLARHGFSVTAVDASGVGLKKAEKLAQKHRVSIETIHVDLAEYTIKENAWDSIVSISCHLPSELRRKIHKSVVAGLKEGGTFLLEAYTPKQLEFATGGPPNADFMMELDTLKKELEGLEFIHGKELIRDVIEGIKHTGKASVVQVFARKI